MTLHPRESRYGRRELLRRGAAGAFLLCHALLRSRIGYYWQAIRENPEAAQALGINTFRYKMAAVVISAAMTALAGVVTLVSTTWPFFILGLVVLWILYAWLRGLRRRKSKG